MVFSLTAIRHLRAEQPVPVLAMLGTFLLGLLSLASVIGFVTHIVRILRMDSMMRAVQDHVIRGTPLATVRSGAEDHEGRFEGSMKRALVMSYERTVEQDAAYGFRQLEDTAVKALSPGINDPLTAAHAVA